MALLLTTHDTRFDDPDAVTIARVLAALDGDRHVLVTLARSELTYLQASGSAQTGLALEYQEESLDRHYTSGGGALPLETVTDIFHRYARDDQSWRDRLSWEHVPYVREKTPWHNTWVAYVIILLTVVVLVWLWRGW
ncbi:MAG TPA: hypothetical protein VMS64_22310 [Candidatus Methylomirabilis sp.]|nr:hypothetical protein [Candidatus Methylomirabilis sp.]